MPRGTILQTFEEQNPYYDPSEAPLPVPQNATAAQNWTPVEPPEMAQDLKQVEPPPPPSQQQGPPLGQIASSFDTSVPAAPVIEDKNEPEKGKFQSFIEHPITQNVLKAIAAGGFGLGGRGPEFLAHLDQIQQRERERTALQYGLQMMSKAAAATAKGDLAQAEGYKNAALDHPVYGPLIAKGMPAFFQKLNDDIKKRMSSQAMAALSARLFEHRGDIEGFMSDEKVRDLYGQLDPKDQTALDKLLEGRRPINVPGVGLVDPRTFEVKVAAPDKDAKEKKQLVQDANGNYHIVNLETNEIRETGLAGRVPGQDKNLQHSDRTYNGQKYRQWFDAQGNKVGPEVNLGPVDPALIAVAPGGDVYNKANAAAGPVVSRPDRVEAQQVDKLVDLKNVAKQARDLAVRVEQISPNSVARIGLSMRAYAAGTPLGAALGALNSEEQKIAQELIDMRQNYERAKGGVREAGSVQMNKIIGSVVVPDIYSKNAASMLRNLADRSEEVHGMLAETLKQSGRRDMTGTKKETEAEPAGPTYGGQPLTKGMVSKSGKYVWDGTAWQPKK